MDQIIYASVKDKGGLQNLVAVLELQHVIREKMI